MITATQMLNSMETSNSRPTRAEATDVFNAVLDGTDAVMLSGETAMGQYPIASVRMMSRIVAEAEAFLAERRTDHSLITPGAGWSNAGWIQPITEGIVEAASIAARRLDAALVVVATHSGRTALAVSKFRNPMPTLALADDPEAARAMNLYWGVTPVLGPNLSDETQNILDFAIDWAKKADLIKSGDRLIYLRGTIPGNRVHNAVVVQEVS